MTLKEFDKKFDQTVAQITERYWRLIWDQAARGDGRPIAIPGLGIEAKSSDTKVILFNRIWKAARNTPFTVPQEVSK